MRKGATIAGWLSCMTLLAMSMPAGADAAGIAPVYGPEQVLPTLPTPVIGAEGVTADAAGNTYALDGNRVLALAPGGAFGSEQVLPFTGLNRPGGIAADPAGDVYVADTGNARVVELTGDGTVVRVLPSGLEAPNAVAVDALGDVFVADRSAAVELEAGAQTWKVLPFGNGILPTGIAVDSKGDVYIANGGGAGDIEELAAGAHSPTAIPLLTGRTLATGPNDELYIGGNDGVEEFPPPSGSGFPASPLPLAGVTDATGVAATARGLYVSDIGGTVYFEPAGSAPPTDEVPLPFTGAGPASPEAVASDGQGNVYEVLNGHVVVQPLGAAEGAARLAPIIGDADSVVADGAGNVYADVGDEPGLAFTIAQWHVGAANATLTYTQNDHLGPIAVDAEGDVFWSETHNGPFAALGTVFRLAAGQDSGQALPFPNLHDPAGLVASAGGDVYVSSDGGLVRLVRAGAKGSSIVPFAVGISQLAVDQSGDVFGTSNHGIVLLPAGGCQANEVPLTFTAALRPQAFAADPRGNLFVADTGNHRVAMFPVTGTTRVPACPLRITGFRLRANGTGKPSLRFKLLSASAHGIHTVTLTLPAGRLRFARGKALKRGLTVRTNRARRPAFGIRHHGGRQLVITLKRPARRLSLTFGHGAIFISSTPGFIYGEGPTTLTVKGSSGRAIPLSVPTLTK
jgi:streptogramin lyase